MKKYVDGQYIELTQQEIDELESLLVAAFQDFPTQADRIEAQVMYTALMTDTLLEGDE